MLIGEKFIMKRTRGVVKKYVESSSSEDENPPNKKLSPENANISFKDNVKVNENLKTQNADGSSSSESDLESYLQRPDKLDLDSEFFNPKQNSEVAKDVPDFNQIENEIFAGVTRLSESDSDSDDDVDFEKKKRPPKKTVQSKKKDTRNLKSNKSNKSKLTISHGKVTESDTESIKSNDKPKKKQKKTNPSTSTFDQLQEYTKKLEEAKKFVEIYKAKKQAEENKIDITSLLATGESLTAVDTKINPGDLHSSDFDSCDSEQEDWEEIKQKEDREEDKTDVPKTNVEITVSMPTTVKKKKGVDLLAAMKRRLNRIRKENQVLIHKVHLLCWVAHGNFLNESISSTQTLGMALSLLPSEQCYPSARTDLSYLEQIVNWYKRTVKCVDKSVPSEVPLNKLLQLQINKKEAYNKKMLVLIFIAILRSLGIQCRLIISLQVEPIRPPASELHSLSLKPEAEGKKKSKKSVKTEETKLAKDSRTSVTKEDKKPNLTKLLAENNLKTADKDVKRATNLTTKKENIDKEVKEKNKSKTEKVIEKDNKNLKVKNVSSRSKSAETKSSAKTKDKLEVPAPRRRSKSNESAKSAPQKSEKNRESKQMTKTKDDLNVSSKNSESKRVVVKENIKTRKSLTVSQTSRRSKSAESVVCETLDKSKLTKKNIKNTKEADHKLNTDKKADSNSSNTNTRRTRSSLSCLTRNDLLTVPTTTKRRSKSTDSNVSDASNISVRSVKSTKSNKSTKSEKTNKSEKQKQITKVKPLGGKKRVPQNDGALYLSDEDEALQSEVGDISRNFKSLHKRDLTKDLYLSNVSEFSDSPDFSDEDISFDDNNEDLCIAQLDGPSVTVSKAKPKAKPNLSKLKQSTEKGKPKVEIKKLSVKSSETANKSPAKQLDVRSDIMNLIKGRIAEQKHADRRKLSNVNKRKIQSYSDSDSDYAPEEIKKKHYDSEDEFSPEQKVKIKRRIPGKKAILAQETEEKKKKIGNDYWVEVFLEAEEKWICADLVYGQVHCVKEVSKRATQPVSYVLAWNNDNTLKDVTQRYCENFNTVTRKMRIDQKWWTESIKPFLGKQTAKDKEEDNDLARQQLDQPLPKSISEYKNHPLYVLRRHLLKFEALYPPEPPTLGFIRGEAVYPRACVYTLHSRDIWLKQAKTVKLGEVPYKIVKARPKWDRLSNKLINDQMLEVFGMWQVQDYVPPDAENGKVPRNAFGNVDLFKPCMLPGGCVHLKLPGLNKICRKLNIDSAAAIVGFDFHGGWSHPVYDGFIVCKEFEDTLINAWEEEQIEIERKEQEKIETRVYGNWKKLIKGLLIRERLKARYDFGAPSGGAEPSKDHKKKAKGPSFCTKKR